MCVLGLQFCGSAVGLINSFLLTPSSTSRFFFFSSIILHFVANFHEYLIISVSGHDMNVGVSVGKGIPIEFNA
jgi:hypothetical protein